jgi:chromosome condensin MukBEF ATPase and DNA-binding subunit MukB
MARDWTTTAVKLSLALAVSTPSSENPMDDLVRRLRDLKEGRCGYIHIGAEGISYLAGIEALTQERDALQVQLVEERGRHQEFERELLARSASVNDALQSRLAGVEKALLDLYGQISQAEECQSVVITSPSLREAMHEAALAIKETP